MKRYISILFISFISFKGYAQTIDILKFNKKEVSLKFDDDQLLNIQLPLKYPFKISLGDVELVDSYIFKNNQKIGKYTRSKIRLEDKKQMFCYRVGNEIFIGNGMRKSKEIIYTKAELKFNEDFGFLEKIIITENNYEDKYLTESWLILKIIENLTSIKSDNSDSYLFGIAIGTILAQ